MEKIRSERKLAEENYIMKILKQLSWITPLALLMAGCAMPVKPDTTIADWQRNGKLPELSATGTEKQQVYVNANNYPAIYRPRIIVQSDTRQNRTGDLALG